MPRPLRRRVRQRRQAGLSPDRFELAAERDGDVGDLVGEALLIEGDCEERGERCTDRSERITKVG